MKKLVLITSIVIANLLTAEESKGQNSVYIITEVYKSGGGPTTNWDSVYVTSPTGSVTGYRIPWRENVAGRDAALNVIINGVTSLGYTISDYAIPYSYDNNGSPTSTAYRWFLKKP